jgi:hypothetical protein
MARSIGRGTGVLVGMLLVAAVVPAAQAAGTGPASSIMGGGDDPSIRRVQSAEDLAIGRWKRGEMLRLRDRTPHQVGDALCVGDCVPSSWSVPAYARAQITWYYCGVATTQVIVNATREVYSTAADGDASATNWVTQSRLGAFMGTTSDSGSSSWMVRDGANAFADTIVGFSNVRFTVLENIASGADFHWAMITSIWDLLRPAAVPVQMTYSSQHLASWSSQTWWSTRTGTVIRHWITIKGYAGFWDGTYDPTLTYLDSAGGLGGGTGQYRDASRLIFNLNQANSKRLVY